MYHKKMAIFYILEILKEYSDKDHLLKQKDIIDKLYDIYDLEIERKTVSSSIDLLIELGYDIHKEKNGCYLNEREFDETQIKFLIDAIYSSKVISSKNAEEISKKLYSFLSKYQRYDYNYVYKTSEITRTDNKQFFYNISIITEAIKLRKKIEFNYLTYNSKGELVEKKDGYKYTVSPYFLINNFGNYYLLCNVAPYDNHSNFRLDFITEIEILDEPIKPYEEISTMGKDFNITKHMNDHIYMFGGNIITAKILVKEDSAVTYIYDWFGKNARLKYEDDKLYAYIRTDDRAFIYWALQFCQQFTVIEPTYVKDRVINILKNSIDDYEKNA